MSRYKSSLTFLCITLILAATLPALAAAVWGRPQGPYRYTVVATSSFQGQTVTGRDRGKLNLSGQRIVGQNNTNTSSFDLRPTTRVTRATNQTGQFSGNWTIIDSRIGVNRGKITGNFRVQKTRIGVWKLSGTFTGLIRQGRARGLTQTGRFTAKSI